MINPKSSLVSFNLIKVSILAGIVGIIGSFAAELLHHMIGIVTNLVFYLRFDTHIVSPIGSPLGILIIFIPALGGLLIGLMARYGSPLVRGHGIPEAMEAVLHKRSKIPPKVALLKPFSAAISIGSGQPFGAEGPIIQTGAALGSLLGQALHTTAAERKVLLACGAAAGLAAAFGTPIAAVIFAVELLLFEFRTRSFVPLAIASTISTVIHRSLIGAEPLFAVTSADFGSPIDLLFFLVLGVICGLAAAALTRLLYLTEDLYHRLPINSFLWPVFGGLFVGVVGYALAAFSASEIDVFGPGYAVIERILEGQYLFGTLLILLVGKAAVWLICLGSGTSGGTLAPMFLIGAAIGGAFGLLVQQIFPQAATAPVAFAMAGMAAVFGSCTRATFAAIIFVFEITHSYESILPVMFASVIADAVVSHLMQTTILTEQLRRKGILVEQDFETDPLGTITVGAVMDKHPVIIPAAMSLQTLVDGLNRRDESLIRHQALLLVDDDQQLQGILTRGDILKALRERSADCTVLEFATTEVITSYPDQTVRDALNSMLFADIGRLPVVSREQPQRIVGYLSRANVIEAHMKRLKEEAVIEAGWLPKRLTYRP